jgi:hypothetical protein
MKKQRIIASASQMRELINYNILTVYREGTDWTAYQGAPFRSHIQWNGEGFGYVYLEKEEADLIEQWIQNELQSLQFDE